MAMRTKTTTMIAASLNEMNAKIYDQAFPAAYPLFALLEKEAKEPFTAANEIIEHLGTSKNPTVGSREYHEAFNFVETDPVEDVSFAPKHISGTAMWFRWQEKVNSGSKREIFSYTKSIKDNLVESLKEEMASQAVGDGTGNGGKDIDGIPAILSATNIYAGKDRSDAANAYWRAQTLSTGGVLQIMGGGESIQKLMRVCGGNGGVDRPNYARTTEDLYEWIEQLIEPTRVRQSEKMVELGWDEHIHYRGCSIFYDDTCVAGRFEALNTKYIKLRPEAENADKFWTSDLLDLLPGHGLDAWGIAFNWTGNITCTKPKRCGALTAKTVG